MVARRQILNSTGLDLPALLEDLSRPGCFPGRPASVQRIETHISAVFIAGEDVYKLKKPVDLGFVDYSSLARRKHFCEEEVRLNRRLAPSVYRGVVPIVRGPEGHRVGGPGEPVEYAVHMRRLADRDRLSSLLESGWAGEREIEDLGRFLAAFHRSASPAARAGAGDPQHGSYPVVRENCLANLERVRPHVGESVSDSVIRRVESLTRSELEARRDSIESRARRGVPRDTHGDLRMDHVYRSSEKSGWEIVDCIEFNPSLRCTDPVADIAFLAMDLRRAGYEGLADRLLDVWFDEVGDREGRQLVPLYTAYRAMVRCKVACLQLEAGKPRSEDASAFALVALGRLAVPWERPCLILLAGLPGTGKSSLARGLSEIAGMRWIRTDVVRKQLAQSAGAPADAGTVEPESGIYTAAWSDATYAECRRQAEQSFFAGERVLIDACFPEQLRREPFLDAARRWAVPCRILHLQANPERVRERLQRRTGDASDADWTTYLALQERWEEFPRAMADQVIAIDADPVPEEVERTVGEALKACELL